jgi:hypothetical protein
MNDRIAVQVNADLDLARSMLGRLAEDTRARVLAAITQPCEATWDAAFSAIVGSDGWMTLWQAVRKVRPDFPSTGPLRERDGTIVKGWSQVPDRAALLSALQFATH